MVQAGPHGAGGTAMAPVLVGNTSEVTEQTLLNEAEFTGYHVFRAETRIVADAGLPPLGASPSELPVTKASGAAPAVQPVNATPSTTATAAAPPANVASAPPAASSPSEIASAAAPNPLRLRRMKAQHRKRQLMHCRKSTRRI